MPGNDYVTLDPADFQFIPEVHSCDILEHAFERYSGYINLDPVAVPDPDANRIFGLRVSVTQECSNGDYPSLDMDESCESLCSGS